MLRSVLALGLLFAAANAVELTESNFDEMTSGKSVFIKFLAPWWGHCKSMKPAWDQLMDEFKDSKTALVADVDCTVEESLCSKHGVQGYPTVKYGNPDALEDYEGGRDFESLKQFASENLGPSCGPDNMDLCSDEQKKTISELQALTQEEREGKIKDAEKAIEDAEAHFTAEVEKLQKKYEQLSEEKDSTIKAAKGPLGMLKLVNKAAGGKSDL